MNHVEVDNHLRGSGCHIRGTGIHWHCHGICRHSEDTRDVSDWRVTDADLGSDNIQVCDLAAENAASMGYRGGKATTDDYHALDIRWLNR